MAKKKSTTRKKTTSRSIKSVDATGKHLVIVESPAKARTINQYLGPDFVVQASVGHIRDLPAKAPKGSKMPVPGVDLDHDFEPSYEVMSDKKKVVTELKKTAKQATDVWFATDLDREGEAIAWHLAELLGVKTDQAKRVVFNAITKSEIQRAFENPHAIDSYKVNAQQARRILDRIVGYQVSPLLWKKVARGLSAGRVQSVAVRLVVERERQIRAFVPDEYWKVAAKLCLDETLAGSLAGQWSEYAGQISAGNKDGKGPTIKQRNAWLAEHGSLHAELVELGGKKFELGCSADEPRDLTQVVTKVADAVGLVGVDVASEPNPKGKGPAATLRTLSGSVDPSARYAVRDVETKRTTSRPPAPFITSTLQMAASTALSMSANQTMRTAQALYEGINIKGEGQVALITYMRTDSTHLSPESINLARTYIKSKLGDDYLPEKPQFYTSSNKAAQEAHEAIRPTDAYRPAETLAGKIDDQQLKLYRLIWQRFVACQMMPAKWDSTNIFFKRSDRETGAVLKASGRVLAFDGFYRVTGVPTSADEQTMPDLKQGDTTAPFDITADQSFTSPPPRYTEASLVKALESEGIGRPSTYASIIKVIQDRNYVEQISRRFHATDLGEVVTDKLIEGFPRLMELSYTRLMEEELDQIEEQHKDWKQMLREFYARFSEALEHAHENMGHAKAEMQPAIYACPSCGGRTSYRFGKNGRFLSCSNYPDCEYAAPIDREGRPLLPERVNMACPEDGSQMILRSGRFGKFIASINYPDIKFVINLDKKGGVKLPARPPVETKLTCPTCDEILYLRRGKRGPWLGCSKFPKCRGRLAWTKVEEAQQKQLELALHNHEQEHPQVELFTLGGRPIAEGTPISDLLIEGEVQELAVHPEAQAESQLQATEAA